MLDTVDMTLVTEEPKYTSKRKKLFVDILWSAGTALLIGILCLIAYFLFLASFIFQQDAADTLERNYGLEVVDKSQIKTDAYVSPNVAVKTRAGYVTTVDVLISNGPNTAMPIYETNTSKPPAESKSNIESA